MRVGQTQRTGAARASGAARRTAGRGAVFHPAGAGTPQRSAALRTGPATVASLDAIVSLQSVDDAQDRRRRAVCRGREMLDLLDELKVAVLSGRISEAKLARLEQIIARTERADDDPGLKDVLEQIDLRARVELAKLRRSAA